MVQEARPDASADAVIVRVAELLHWAKEESENPPRNTSQHAYNGLYTGIGHFDGEMNL